MTKLFASLLIVCAISAVAFAQKMNVSAQPTGTGGTPQPITPTIGNGTPGGEVRPYSHSVTGKVLMTSSADHSMLLKVGNAPAVKIIVDDQTRKTADKKTEFAGKKQLSFTDYKAGQTLKVTFRVSDNKVLEVRLKPTPK